MGAQNGMAVPALEPAAEIDLALPIRAPAQAGRYVSYWRLMYDEGDSQRRFGHRLWCDITSEETAQQAQVSAPTAPQANVRPPAPQLPASSALEAQLSLLTEMGFTDVDRNCQLLSEFDFETTMQKLLQG
jgi:hypothetical protein